MADGTLAVQTLSTGLQLGSQVLGVRGRLSLSPDRRRLAVHGFDGVHLVDPGGTPQLLVDQPVRDLSWAPDGGALSYLSKEAPDSPGTLSVISADGTVTDVATDATSAGIFTPDGRALVFPKVVGRTTDAEQRAVFVVRFE